MKRNKIIFFLIEKNYSGASKIATWLANELSKNYEVEFLTLKTSFPDGLNDGIKFFSLGQSLTNKITFYIKSIKLLRNFFKLNNCDLIMTFMPTETMLINLAVRGLGIPFITSERSDPYFEKSIVASIGRRMYKNAHAVVFQTYEARKYFSFIKDSHSYIIPNPVLDLNCCNELDYVDRENVIVTTGRLYLKQKRQDLLINAMEIIHKEKPEFILKIYGNGPDEELLKKIVTTRKMNGYIQLLGKVDNVLECIQNSKLFMFSSDYEGIPNSIIEALSVSVPVVTTDCSPGGAKLLIQNGKNGYVVPRGDYSEIAQKAIMALEQGKFLATNCKNSLRPFDEKIIFSKWMNCISKVLLEDK